MCLPSWAQLIASKRSDSSSRARIVSSKKGRERRRSHRLGEQTRGALSLLEKQQKKKKHSPRRVLPSYLFLNQAARPAPKRASVAVRAADNEVDVDAIVKDIQQKVKRVFFLLLSLSRRLLSSLSVCFFRSRTPSLFLFLSPFSLSKTQNPKTTTQWDAVEDKPSAILYAGGAVVLLWLASTVVGAVNAVPLLPKLLELVGLGYTSWFVYRYLLFKSSREELLADVEELKKKITS